jgi:hypothetical protein
MILAANDEVYAATQQKQANAGLLILHSTNRIFVPNIKLRIILFHSHRGPARRKRLSLAGVADDH